MKNVVIIGGGTGTSSLIRAIKDINNIKLSVIVTVADSGGSTGRIREEYNLPGIGDIRQVLIALSHHEGILTDLMKYRFKESRFKEQGNLSNHSLGNLIIASLIDIKQDFYSGIKYLSDVFNVKGEIVPITDNPNIQLCATYSDGTKQIKEHLIPSSNKKIEKISYENQDFEINPRAITVLSEADYIIFGCGSLYTSLIANLCIPKIKNEIIKNEKAQLIYVCNLVTQPNETDNMTAYDHIKAIEDHLSYGCIDTVIINNKKVNSEIFEKYKKANQNFIFADDKLLDSHCEIIQASLIDNNNESFIRHDVKKIKKVLKTIIKEN